MVSGDHVLAITGWVAAMAMSLAACIGWVQCFRWYLLAQQRQAERDEARKERDASQSVQRQTEQWADWLLAESLTWSQGVVAAALRVRAEDAATIDVLEQRVVTFTAECARLRRMVFEDIPLWEIDTDPQKTPAGPPPEAKQAGYAPPPRPTRKTDPPKVYPLGQRDQLNGASSYSQQ